MKNNEEVNQELNKETGEEHLLQEMTQNEVDDSSEVDSPEAKLESEVIELKEKYLRLYSDFENFRKRTSRERIELITTASEDVLRDLIPVVDDFERALKASENDLNNAEGNKLIFQKLVRILETKGLKVMDDLTGQVFNPDTQEAIAQIPAPSEELKGKVLDVIEKGYTLGDKVVRFAKVVTGA